LTTLGELVDPAAIAGLLALASAAADGAPIGLYDLDGRLVAGADVPGGRTQAIAFEDHTLGTLTAEAGASSELLALVAGALELVLIGASEHAGRARVAQELAIGRRIQLALLPRHFPDVAGWRFAADYEAAREIGGDLFDTFPLRGRTDQIGLLIADVTGKGIPAALLMADVRALLHAATDNADGPADALARVNRILVAERPTSLFVTAALLVLDAQTGRLRLASAGHEPPLVVRRAGPIERLEATGPILGAFGDASFEERNAELEPGDALVLYTDGVTDARDRNGVFYGDERLFATLAASAGMAAEAILRSVIDDVRAFRGDADPFDDLTLLVTERLPA